MKERGRKKFKDKQYDAYKLNSCGIKKVKITADIKTDIQYVNKFILTLFEVNLLRKLVQNKH